MKLRPFAWATIAAAAGTMALATAPVFAVQQAKSRYSTIELSKCSSSSKRAAGKQAWRCQGLPGYPLYVAIGQSRTSVSVGPRPEAHRAAKQSLGAANTLFDGKSPRSAIEWRFVIREKKTVPYATIVRYFTQDVRGRGEVVVVTRVADGESCQVARIDALANPEAMVIAREIADRKARTFDCRQEPAVIGATGKSPM